MTFKYLIISLNFIAILMLTTGYTNEYGPDYGEEWLYFIDDNSSTHVMNFSTLPSDSRGLLLGDAYFYLYTRKNADSPELLTIPNDGSNIKSDYFNPKNNMKALTHGWLSKGTSQWLLDVKDALLRKDDFNVIIIDWSDLAVNPLYPWSALCTRYVGKRMAQLISVLVRTYGIQGKRMHLVGHSLGAQVMGYAGMFSNETIYRITGLDPARPMFEIPRMSADFRLERSDAEFVDIIHTCGGVLGYRNSHGHADFYPNKGTPQQPGCEGVQETIEACSHGRSYDYFEESIESEGGFLAYMCENWERFENNECKDKSSYMGYPAAADRTPNGDYFLRTRNHSKYAMESK